MSTIQYPKKKIFFFALIGLVIFVVLALFSIFFDQAVLVRKGTFYHADITDKAVALTFDDGPSQEWTPQILDELKKSGVQATFFVIGDHVKKYPDIARRIVAEGHDIGNHTTSHVVLFVTDGGTLKRELNQCQRIIQETTGVWTNLFRPPKAWLTPSEKRKIQRWGYKIILWTLNSKDWVMFDDKYIVRYLLRNVRPGDIILFHDSGGALNIEGGDRHETVLAVRRLIEELHRKGYRFVTISQLLKIEEQNAQKKDP